MHTINWNMMTEGPGPETLSPHPVYQSNYLLHRRATALQIPTSW